MSEEEINKLVEDILKQIPISITDGISEYDYDRIMQKIKEMGWKENEWRRTKSNRYIKKNN